MFQARMARQKDAQEVKIPPPEPPATAAVALKEATPALAGIGGRYALLCGA